MKYFFPVRLAAVMAVQIGVATFGFGQGQQIGQAPPAPTLAAQASPPIPVLKLTTRMVTLQVVARDRQGHPVQGLTAKDFQVFEEAPPKNDKRLQHIAAFQPVSAATVAATGKDSVQIPPGVYSNFVSTNKTSVAPTILLFDGINTPAADQAQTRRQMVKLLASIPADTPVAVFLLGRRLRMLQDFTTDPKQLIEAAKKASSLDSAGLAEIDPSDDPDSLSAQMEAFGSDTPPAVPGAAAMASVSGQGKNDPSNNSGSDPQRAVHQMEVFMKEVYAVQIDIRMQATIDALRSLARHLSGYEGRKNVLWVSSSFPLHLAPEADAKTLSNRDLTFAGNRNYEEQMAAVARALSDAKIAVYPVDPSGLQTESYFQASTRISRSTTLSGTQTGDSIRRESGDRDFKQASMDVLAEGTGGRTCVSNNDLADCVKKAMDDGSSYYELAYYPDSTSWNGEFHRIMVKTSQSGVHLVYRQGYYAPIEAGGAAHKDDAKRAGRELREAACDDLLTSTALLVFAKPMQADQAGKAKYFLAIDPKLLTFAPAEDGTRKLSLNTAICTFDQKGNALQFFTQRSEEKVGEKEFASLTAVPHVVQIPLGPGVSRLRVVVQDAASGAMGSVNIPYAAAVPPPLAPGSARPAAASAK